MRRASTLAVGRILKDAKDPDAGANGLQNFPLVTSANIFGGTTVIKATLESTPSIKKSSKTCTMRLFPTTASTGTRARPPWDRRG